MYDWLGFSSSVEQDANLIRRSFSRGEYAGPPNEHRDQSGGLGGFSAWSIAELLKADE